MNLEWFLPFIYATYPLPLPSLPPPEPLRSPTPASHAVILSAPAPRSRPLSLPNEDKTNQNNMDDLKKSSECTRQKRIEWKPITLAQFYLLSCNDGAYRGSTKSFCRRCRIKYGRPRLTSWTQKCTWVLFNVSKYKRNMLKHPRDGGAYPDNAVLLPHPISRRDHRYGNHIYFTI